MQTATLREACSCWLRQLASLLRTFGHRGLLHMDVILVDGVGERLGCTRPKDPRAPHLRRAAGDEVGRQLEGRAALPLLLNDEAASHGVDVGGLARAVGTRPRGSPSCCTQRRSAESEANHMQLVSSKGLLWVP